MAVVRVCCPYCRGDRVIKFGVSGSGKQRYLCKSDGCTKKTFLSTYQQAGSRPGIKETIVTMSINGSGVRDTARVLGISVNTVLSALKKKKAA